MIAEKPSENETRPRSIRVVYTIPVCPEHGLPMKRYSPGKGAVRYFRCSTCGRTATGTKRTFAE